MNEDASQALPNAINGSATPEAVHRVAQKAHEAVDKLEQSIGSGSAKVVSLQEEYGEMCREHVKANPLVSVLAAFGAGVIFSKVFLR